MREISTKKIEIGEHVLIDGVEYVAEEGCCGDCELGDYSDCDYALFCPVGGKLTKVKKQPADEHDKDTLMTNIQLAEWLAKGNGQYRFRKDLAVDNILIRPWGTDEWIKPTVGIYERDCR